MKLVNGSFDSALLYHYNPNIELVKTIGSFNYNVITKNNFISIPIFISGKLSYTLNLISKKRIKMNKIKLELVEILKKYLI